MDETDLKTERLLKNLKQEGEDETGQDGIGKNCWGTVKKKWWGKHFLVWQEEKSYIDI